MCSVWSRVINVVWIFSGARGTCLLVVPADVCPWMLLTHYPVTELELSQVNDSVQRFEDDALCNTRFMGMFARCGHL